jgi:hypothetical protein
MFNLGNHFMTNDIFSLYPPDEQPLFLRLAALLEDWKKETAKSTVVCRADGKHYPGDSYFADDGFLPYYYRRKPKTLFIARETRYIAGQNNIEIILKKCRENPGGIGGEILLRRMLLIAYGICQGGTVPFEAVDPRELCALAGTKDGFSFAFMEISKYSNENDDGGNADTGLIRSFFENSNLQKRNFFREELSLLAPDLVITMNLWDGKIAAGHLELALGKAPYIDMPHPGAARRSLAINGKTTPLIDMYHFSARKSDSEDFYKPVMRIIRSP